MSRKRDTNWTRDEITVLLDSIMEMTQMRADGGRRTNSREVFEYAAKKLGEKGHTSRAEREKCRTKWKKMKEEFTHARRARETGQGRVAPGIEPFYSRMLEFINGSYDNISPHSTIVRRSSSISSNNTSGTNNGSSTNGHSSNGTSAGMDSDMLPKDDSSNGNIGIGPAPSTTPTNSSNKVSHAASRASARLAANSNGVYSNDTSETSSSAIANRQGSLSASADLSSGTALLSHAVPAPRLALRTSLGGTGVSINNNHNNRASSASNNNNTDNGTHASSNNNNNGGGRPYPSPAINGTGRQNNHDQQSIAALPKVAAYNDPSYSNHIHDNSSSFNNTTNNNNTSSLNGSNDFASHLPPADRDADISYRVSTGCRQIIIFGDHDVDIKFRGDCVTINKISADFANPPGTANSSDM